MMRFGMGFLAAIAGYALLALAGYFLIDRFSSNTHDRAVEAAMTSVFVLGPLGAVVGFILGFWLSGGKPD
jgi:MFS family permease